MELYILKYGLQILCYIGFSISFLLAIIYYYSRKEIKALRDEISLKNQETAITNIILNQKELLVESLKDEQVFLAKKLELATEERFKYEKEFELISLKYTSIQNQLSAWEKLKEESMNNARAAIFAVGNELSNKLLEDHKRESEQAKEVNEKIIKDTTNHLHTQFQNIISSVATINEQVQHSNSSFEKIKRALLSPIGAGSLAEITLENILKASGLIPDKDYITQFTVNNEEIFGIKLRPDAVIFLPSNNIMIVDSKASSYFFNFEGELSQEVINGKIKSAMRTHLKDLVNKTYFKAVKDHIEKHFNFKVNFISMIMFVPTEAALEKIQSLDGKFIIDAWSDNIYPAGPIGLVNILSYTKFMISENSKNENHRLIITQIEKLLQNISKIYEYTNKVGTNLQTSIKNFDKLAASFNGNFIPKIKNLERLGLTNTLKFKKMSRIHFVQNDELEVIEVEDSNILVEEEN